MESIIARLAVILGERRTLSIGVAAKQRVIEGMVTDQDHPVLSDLATRLHFAEDGDERSASSESD